MKSDDDTLPLNKSLSQLKIVSHNEGLVVQSNKLIDAAYRLSLEEMRLLYIALKKINRRMEVGPDGLLPEITVSVSEYREAFGIKTHALHERLADTANSLLMKPLVTFDWNEDKKKMDKTKRLWFTSLAYDAEGDVSSIKLRFSPELRPLIYELTTNFTKIDFEQVSRLDTPFSMRLYQWLSKFKGLRKSNRGDGVFETEPFEIDDIKSKTGLDNKYKEFKFFKRDMLDPAIHRINNKTDLSVNYKLIKKGRSVQSIVFVFISDTEAQTAKPLRPRLPGRPRVIKDSHAEGEWARQCIAILEKYQSDLKEYDDKAYLPIRDAEKLITYYQIIGDKRKKQDLSVHLDSRRMTKI
ncbi:replication initiation protein [Acerihabitans sp. TG2]|uniref:replication initiation protein n=1 Tax=Acerihabitans sp. TG2 TaxID=3096008 RepID=UPI002B2250A5|nr:replication initiation protein [Acerihabitans sp. TG2]MEA9392208.1 replication initiation protein [Acerihabitans sp. TG2]